MELRQLEYFVAVAEEASFTRAAERVFISQSGVSAQIKALEQELGAPLFDRTARAVRLTPAGEAALDHARAVLAGTAAVRHAVDEVNGLMRGRLRVGMVTGCTIAPLFDALAAFHRAHPLVDLALGEASSEQMADALASGALDVALLAAPGPLVEDATTLPIVTERLVALVPAGHPLAGRATATAAEVAAHPLVCLPPGAGIRAAFEQGCATLGVRFAITLEATAPSAVADLAARGLGVAVLSESMGEGPGRPGSGREALVAVPIADLPLEAVLALRWSAGGAPAVRAFVAEARRCFGL